MITPNHLQMFQCGNEIRRTERSSQQVQDLHESRRPKVCVNDSASFNHDSNASQPDVVQFPKVPWMDGANA